MVQKQLSRAARAGTARSTRAGAGENIFIAFLAELGNFKHFEPHLFFGKFWPFLALRPLWPSKAKKNFFHGRARQTASSEQIKFFWVWST